MTVYSSLDSSITNILKLANVVDNLFEECMYKDIQNNPLETHVVLENLDYFLNKAKQLGYLVENTILAVDNKGVFYYLTPSELSLHGAKQCNISKFPLLSEFTSNRLDTSVSEKVWKADSLSPKTQRLYNLVYNKQKNNTDIELTSESNDDLVKINTTLSTSEPIENSQDEEDKGTYDDLIKIDVPLATTNVVDEDEDDDLFFPSDYKEPDKHYMGDIVKYLAIGVSSIILLGGGYLAVTHLHSSQETSKPKVVSNDVLSSIFTNSKHTNLVNGLNKNKFLTIKESLSKSDKEKYSNELFSVETYFNMDSQLSSIADGSYDTLEDSSFYTSLENTLNSIHISSLKAKLSEKFTYIYSDYQSYLSIIGTLNTYPTDIDTFNNLDSQINNLSSYSPKLVEDSKSLFKEVKDYQESLGYLSDSSDNSNKIVE